MRLLYLPMRTRLPVIMVISVIGVYSANQAVLDLVLLCGFGLLGYWMRRNGYPVAPVILGLVLGNRMEESARQSMIMTQGSVLAVFDRPLGVFFLALAVCRFNVRSGCAQTAQNIGHDKTGSCLEAIGKSLRLSRQLRASVLCSADIPRDRVHRPSGSGAPRPIGRSRRKQPT